MLQGGSRRPQSHHHRGEDAGPEKRASSSLATLGASGQPVLDTPRCLLLTVPGSLQIRVGDTHRLRQLEVRDGFTRPDGHSPRARTAETEDMEPASSEV